MFTGIVEEVGVVVSTIFNGASGSYTLRIQTRKLLQNHAAKLGDSVAVNGVCLTITNIAEGKDGVVYFDVDFTPETARRTKLKDLKVRDEVNLEKSITGATSMGGHFVQGHVDGTGTIARLVMTDTYRSCVCLMID